MISAVSAERIMGSSIRLAELPATEYPWCYEPTRNGPGLSGPRRRGVF
jgi:hypothetical protein